MGDLERILESLQQSRTRIDRNLDETDASQIRTNELLSKLRELRGRAEQTNAGKPEQGKRA